MISLNDVIGRAVAVWRSTWPLWALLLFTTLGLLRWVPAGYERAFIAVPILLSVPGSLTLGALLGGRRLDGIAFSCFTVLSSLVWVVMASLVLYPLGFLITARSTYECLLLICVVLAAFAQVRLHTGFAADRRSEESLSMSAIDAGNRGSLRATWYAVAALAGGALLLIGGGYIYVHSPRPATADYMWISWTGPQVTGVVPVGTSGTQLPFEIQYHEPAPADFRLTASWTGLGAQHALATPVVLHLTPNGTTHGALTIPAPPGGCVYRIVVTVTRLGQVHPESWSINADVRRGHPARNVCASL
jgi:hypothetical protein